MGSSKLAHGQANLELRPVTDTTMFCSVAQQEEEEEEADMQTCAPIQEYEREIEEESGSEIDDESDTGDSIVQNVGDKSENAGGMNAATGRHARPPKRDSNEL
jgi:hypothetical protein